MIVDAMKDLEDKFNAEYWEKDEDRKVRPFTTMSYNNAASNYVYFIL